MPTEYCISSVCGSVSYGMLATRSIILVMVELKASMVLGVSPHPYEASESDSISIQMHAKHGPE